MTDSAVRPERPRNIVIAVGGLIVAAVFGAIATVSLNSGAYRTWAIGYVTNQDRKDVASKKLKSMPTDIPHSIDKIVHSESIATVVSALLLIVLAVAFWQGRYWARWATIGVWALGTFGGSLIGVFALLQVSGGAPATYRFAAFLGGVAMLLAVVFSNSKPALAYLSFGRPVRERATGGGGLFASRAMRAAQTQQRRSTAKDAIGVDRTPATTRPAPARPASQRPQSKQRTSASDPIQVPVEQPTDAGDPRGATRPRGKSRKV